MITLFICLAIDLKKEIKLDNGDIKTGKICRVYIDEKEVGAAKHNKDFCNSLAANLKADLEKKGFICQDAKSIK